MTRAATSTLMPNNILSSDVALFAGKYPQPVDLGICARDCYAKHRCIDNMGLLSFLNPWRKVRPLRFREPASIPILPIPTDPATGLRNNSVSSFHRDLRSQDQPLRDQAAGTAIHAPPECVLAPALVDMDGVVVAQRIAMGFGRIEDRGPVDKGDWVGSDFVVAAWVGSTLRACRQEF